jgi:hypothetical protein
MARSGKAASPSSGDGKGLSIQLRFFAFDGQLRTSHRFSAGSAPSIREPRDLTCAKQRAQDKLRRANQRLQMSQSDRPGRPDIFPSAFK